MLIIVTLSVFLIARVEAIENYDPDWDLNYPCRTDIQKLAEAHSMMARCATLFSSPPTVCSNCFRAYIDMKHAEYRTHHLDNLFSIDNQTCATVIYSNYVLSYANTLTGSMTQAIWDNSRCSSCLSIQWDFVNFNSTVRFDSKTTLFQTLLLDWRTCVENSAKDQKNVSFCDACGVSFNTLFDFYWKIYIEPEMEFCIDIESTMNDTMNIWHNVWECPDDSHPINHHNDVIVVMFSATLLAIVIALFYASAYIQTENSQINFIQYSRMIVPSSTRYRLLGSSNVHDSAGRLLLTD